MTGDVTELSARMWCQNLARTLQVEHIQRNGQPYLERYFIRRAPRPAIFLHHFVASDGTDVHSHPWGWSTSLILAGGYREERCSPDGVIVRELRAGDVNVLQANDKHRIELLDGGDCWTIFLAGNFEKAWSFSPQC